MPADFSRFHQGFYDEADEHIATIVELTLALEQGAGADDALDALFRAAHSIKGGAAAFDFHALARTTHELESLLDKLRNGTATFTSDTAAAILETADVLTSIVHSLRAGVEVDANLAATVASRIAEIEAPKSELFELFEDAEPSVQTDVPAEVQSELQPEVRPQAQPEVQRQVKREAQPAPKAVPEPAAREGTSIRVDLRKIDQLINVVGELVIAHSMLVESATGLDELEHARLMEAIEKVQRHTRDLREQVMGVRMVPIASLFERYPRMVRDLSRRLGKEVRLDVRGGETELDKSLIESLADPLTHLIRNAVDHGIESAEAREASGKAREGRIGLRAASESGQIVIQIQDDGAGFDRDALLRRAQSLGIAIASDAPDSEVWQLIFEAGLSTANAVTDVSGRGVGMDVVRQNVVALQGSIELQSERGAGTIVTIRMPLTLAILDGLSVRVRDESYIIPLTSIVESIPVDAADHKVIPGLGTAMHFRGNWVPVIELARSFSVPGTSQGDGVAVVFETDGKRAALLVDSLEAQHQVVIKSLEQNFRPVRGLAAATVLGTGHVAFILDLKALLRMEAA